MADVHIALRRATTRAADRVPVEVYRCEDGRLLVHSCPDDMRGLPSGCVHVGRALLPERRWSLRLGCPVARAKAAAVPPEFGAQLIAEIQVIG